MPNDASATAIQAEKFLLTLQREGLSRLRLAFQMQVQHRGGAQFGILTTDGAGLLRADIDFTFILPGIVSLSKVKQGNGMDYSACHP